ncbi:hypothetical protein HZC53_00665 [Candidatus Uhrbacteria bacterium]|nr:hypothetical protein [Candidatus Uhrbacteria bacterium]
MAAGQAPQDADALPSAELGDDDLEWVDGEKGNDLAETVRPEALPTDGPASPDATQPAADASLVSNDWASPPIKDELSEVQATGSSRDLPGVDPEASAVVELAFEEMTKKPAPESPDLSATITVEEADGDEVDDDSQFEDSPQTPSDQTTAGGEGTNLSKEIPEREKSDPATLQVREASCIPISDFDNAPRAPGASVPPPDEKRSAQSLMAISTLIKLADMVGHQLSEENQSMDDAHVAALKTLLIDGKWPEDEDLARGAIIALMIEMHPFYAKQRKKWPDKPFAELRRLLLDELGKSKIPPLKRLAKVLSAVPPPIPKSVRPNK